MRTSLPTLVACALMSSLLAPQAESADGTKATPSNATAAGDLVPQGKAVYAQWCVGCHGPMAGTGGFGGFPPAGTKRLQDRYKGAVPATLEDRVDLTPDLIRSAVRQGRPIMPPLRKTEVTDADLEAVIAYLLQKQKRE